MSVLSPFLISLAALHFALSLRLHAQYQTCSTIFNVDLLHVISAQSIAVLCRNDIDKDQPILIYNISSAIHQQINKNKSELVTALAYSQETKLLVIGEMNSTVVLHDAALNKKVVEMRIAQQNVQMLDVEFDSKLKLIVLVGSNGHLCLFDARTYANSCTLAHAFNATAVHVQQNGNVVTCGGDRLCKIWRIQQHSLQLTLFKTYTLRKVANPSLILSSIKRLVVAGNEGYESFLLTSQNGSEKEESRIENIANRTVCALLTERWSSLLTVSTDGTLIVTQLMSGMVTSRKSLPDKITSCEFVNTSTLITGHLKGTVRVWQI